MTQHRQHEQSGYTQIGCIYIHYKSVQKPDSFNMHTNIFTFCSPRQAL